MTPKWETTWMLVIEWRHPNTIWPIPNLHWLGGKYVITFCTLLIIADWLCFSSASQQSIPGPGCNGAGLFSLLWFISGAWEDLLSCCWCLCCKSRKPGCNYHWESCINPHMAPWGGISWSRIYEADGGFQDARVYWFCQGSLGLPATSQLVFLFSFHFCLIFLYFTSFLNTIQHSFNKFLIY